jgi:hypothetical protein
MFWIRLLFLAASLISTGWYIDREQRMGRLQHLDDLFLDFLTSNSRERLSQPDPSAEGQVVMVALRETDRLDYSGWPPKPLDWQILLKSLQGHEPVALVLATPLNWGSPAPEFLSSLADTLLPYTSVISAAETILAEKTRAQASPPFLGDLVETLPLFQRIEGDLHLAPAIAALVSVPDPALRVIGELGLEASQLDPAGSCVLPYALRVEDRLYPSLLAQALARLTGTPYADHRIRLGPGAAAYLSNGAFVPLGKDGLVKVDCKGKVPVINALDLMTGTLAETLSPEGKSALGIGKVIVIGLDHDDHARPRPAFIHAQALNQLLALPHLTQLVGWPQWLVWGIAVLASAWIALGHGAQHPLRSGLICIFAALLISFIAFHALLVWVPPAMPGALMVTGSLVGWIAGKRMPKDSGEASNLDAKV